MVFKEANTISRLMAPDGKSYAFDDRGKSGFGQGEGMACLVLKPLHKST